MSKNLEDVDLDLYNSLQNLLVSDVDSLCLTFTSNDNEFGVCKSRYKNVHTKRTRLVNLRNANNRCERWNSFILTQQKRQL